ncbi:MAG TPA: MarR family winged helix-turn-helix transcriptional regulator [Phycisphaerales bacterium]|nr:MarR family winged helix-turn-helix transcriptional regulator [Phycisphaerales bacterium]
MTSPPDQRIPAGLARIGLVLRHHAWAAAGERGLTPTQSQLLAFLDARHRDGLPVSTLAAELALSQPTVSDAVAALDRKGLVARSRSGDDGRVVLVRLTARGRREAGHASRWPDFLLRAIDSLDADERAAFLRGLVKMIHSLQEDGQIPVSRMCPSCDYFRPHAHTDRERPHHCAYVDAPIGDADLRIDCGDHRTADANERPRLWRLFIGGRPPGADVPHPALPES